MKILALSDCVVNWIYSSNSKQLLSDIDLAISCGDLPGEYLDFIVSSLNIPMFFVYGNHSMDAHGESDQGESNGRINLHRRVRKHGDIFLAGIEGSLRYNQGDYQYSQFDMWLNVFSIVPQIMRNRIFGRKLNILVTHAPPFGIQDQTDFAHQGIKAFRWFITVFKPEYHLHGHIHVYRPDTVTETKFGGTRVINVYAYRMLEL